MAEILRTSKTTNHHSIAKQADGGDDQRYTGGMRAHNVFFPHDFDRIRESVVS